MASEPTGPTDAEIVSALRALAAALHSGLSEVDTDDLVSGAQHSERLRAETPGLTGRLLAELHRRGHSWPVIARMTGISQSTAFRRADPYLGP